MLGGLKGLQDGEEETKHSCLNQVRRIVSFAVPNGDHAVLRTPNRPVSIRIEPKLHQAIEQGCRNSQPWLRGQSVERLDATSAIGLN